jgi:LysR family transcriptional regulator, hca operon transcriptional activator
MERGLELRHLRYFVAVAEEGSLTVAAERRLHTAQPSLSRQIRDLEHEVGVELLVRSARGIELLDYTVIVEEPLVVAMPSDHRLASQNTVALQDIAGEIFIGMSNTAPRLRVIIDQYLERSGLNFQQSHRVDNLAMAMSLIASTRGVALLPTYAKNFLPLSVTSRPLDGEAPMIDLVIGYNKSNTSPILGLFLSRLDQLRKKAPQTH